MFSGGLYMWKEWGMRGLVKRVYDSEVRGVRRRGRPRKKLDEWGERDLRKEGP